MSDRIGSAEWISPNAVAKKFAYEEGAFWLGRTIDRDATPIGIKDDRHVLIVAGTRCGKGTTILVNNLCLWPGSALVIDPKGENATITATRRGGGESTEAYQVEGLGQAVHVLDPYGVAHVPNELRACFNPIDWLNAEDPLLTKKAERLATALIPITNKEEAYWDNEARSLLGALMIHVATCVMYEGKRNLMTVRDLVMRGDVATYEAAEQKGVYLDPPISLLWESMQENPVADGYVRDQGVYFQDMVAGNSKQWTGVRGGVKTATDFVNGPGMRKSLERSTFSFDELKTSEKGATVYLSIPQDFLTADRGWMRMMIEVVAMQCKLIGGQPRSGHPVLLMLDEFAGLERMDVLENSIAQLAGYGVKMVCVIQNLPQLKEVYKDSWETFISGAGAKIYFANEDNYTREYISKQAGQTEIIREGRSSNQSRAENETATEGFSVTRGHSSNEGTTKHPNRSRGSSVNIGLNMGGSNNTNYEANGGLLNLFPSKSGTSKGGGGGVSGGYSRSSHQTAKSKTTGTAKSYSESHQQSKTTGTTVTEGEGVGESFHQRYLIEPQEVGYKFAPVKDVDDPRYPGVILVMISGVRPMPIRKCNYYEDPNFCGYFTPHPDHEFRPLTDFEKSQPYAFSRCYEPPRELLEFRIPSYESMKHYIAQGTLVPQMRISKLGERVTPGAPAMTWNGDGDSESSTSIAYPPALTIPAEGYLYQLIPFNSGSVFGQPFVRIECERVEDLDEPEVNWEYARFFAKAKKSNVLGLVGQTAKVVAALLFGVFITFAALQGVFSRGVAQLYLVLAYLLWKSYDGSTAFRRAEANAAENPTILDDTETEYRSFQLRENLSLYALMIPVTTAVLWYLSRWDLMNTTTALGIGAVLVIRQIMILPRTIEQLRKGIGAAYKDPLDPVPIAVVFQTSPIPLRITGCTERSRLRLSGRHSDMTTRSSNSCRSASANVPSPDLDAAPAPEQLH